MKLLFILAVFTFSFVSLGCAVDGSSGFMPKNDMRIPVGLKRMNAVTEQRFNDVITKVETVYAPIVANMGGKLHIARMWDNEEVNAMAFRDITTDWEVEMFGGLARHPAITEDGLALVVCHEIGHHIGGAPKKIMNKWSSAEGQADYFATLKCLRKVFLNDNNQAIVQKLKAPASLVQACKKAHFNLDEAALCVRTSMAGDSVSRLFAAMKNKAPALFETPDKSKVTVTFESHPDFQCRLDTFFQGSLCDRPFNEDVSQTIESTGTCHESLGSTSGLRPKCWHKSTF